MNPSKQVKTPVADLLDATAAAKALLQSYSAGDFASSAHTHILSDVDELVDALASKYDSSHVGTTANKLVQLTAAAKLPAVDGSLLTNLSGMFQYREVDGDYTATNSDYVINCVSNSFSITLPTAVGISGRCYQIKNSGGGVINIETTSGQIIDAYASGELELGQFDSVLVQSNGSNWIVLLLLTGSGSTASYLDASLSTALRVFGLRKAFSAYSGSCLRVRRSSDDTEQDIGFTSSGYLDTATLLTFCGAGNGFVKTWYDQSGSSLDITQSTTTKQPKIVNSGALMQDAGYGCTIKCDGFDDFLLSSNYDLTATDEATLLCGIGTIESIGANKAVLYSSGDINNKGIGFLGWYDGKPLATTFTVNGGGFFEGWTPDSPGTGRRILGFKANNSEASGSKVVPFWNNSYSQTGWTQILSSGTTGSFSDNPISMGSASDGTTSSTASFDFICFANRLLTEDEARTITAFFRRGGIMLGDSTTADFPATVPVASLVYSETDRVKGNPIESLADGGDTIAQQKTLWQSNNQRKSVAWVTIQVGLNNMNPASSSTAATIAEYQDLVDTIRADNATCKIIGLTMTPAYENWTDIGWTPAGAQARWVALNDAIMGRGASPITGLDASVESHTLALSMDVSGNAALAVAYQNGDHIHTNTAGRTINAASIRTALVSLRML